MVKPTRQLRLRRDCWLRLRVLRRVAAEIQGETRPRARRLTLDRWLARMLNHERDRLERLAARRGLDWEAIWERAYTRCTGPAEPVAHASAGPPPAAPDNATGL